MFEQESIKREVKIPVHTLLLEGELILPAGARGIVVFAHGSGSSRHSARNKFVASIMREKGLGTLLFDLLTKSEEAVDIYTRHLRFDINLLAQRLVAVTNWLSHQEETKNLNIGFFGSSTGAAAALVAAAALDKTVGAVVTRGGRVDLAGKVLPIVESPVLLIVGGRDHRVLELNEEAYRHLYCEKELRVVDGASHLFEEPGTLEKVSSMAADWFAKYLQTAAQINSKDYVLSTQLYHN